MVVLVAIAAVTATGAANGDRQPRRKRVVAVIHTTDFGCAGQAWAADTITRVLKVSRNPDGSYRISEQDSGRFVTKHGRSPGNCAGNRTRHGRTIRAGVVGAVAGYLNGTVTNGTFDPKAACANPCSQTDFVAAYFGAGATFSCLTNSRDCRFRWGYHAKRSQRLRFRYFEDRGSGAGTFLKERFQGDIAGA